jgi:glycine C-acetyltransferase
MTKSFLTYLNSELKELRNTGLYKSERVIASKQAGTVALESGREVINLFIVKLATLGLFVQACQ